MTMLYRKLLASPQDGKPGGVVYREIEYIGVKKLLKQLN
jgi:hypothetical protein